MGFSLRPASARRGAHAAALIGMSVCALAAPAANAATPDDLEMDHKGAIAKAFDYVANNTYMRLGVGYLDYSGDSSNLRVEDAQGLAAQAFGPGQSDLEGTGSSLGNKTFPSGTLGMFIPKTGRHLAFEVTLAAPIKLDFQVSGDAVYQSLAPDALQGNGSGNTIPTGVEPLGRNIGTLKTLPPNFSIVYRPWTDTTIRPYIGAGAMYLYTYDTDVSNTVLNSANEPSLYLSKPVACTGKAGVDVFMTESVFLSAEARYIGCATVEAKLNNIQVKAPELSDQFGTIDVGTVSSENDFEAMLYQLSFGIQF